MQPQSLAIAVSTVPAGAWAVGVSGGADSVALLDLLRRRADLELHVVHLDHETRESASTGDAQFVADWCQRWNLPCTIARRSEIEPALADLPANPSARYRAVRLELFRRVISQHQLRGVILAHHADDQAETVFQRLLRSSGYSGLVGMALQAQVRDVAIVRPLLTVHRHELREYLKQQGMSWREDTSNQSDDYQRNRVRRVLEQSPTLTGALLDLSRSCGDLRDWVQSNAPVLDEKFRATVLMSVPKILAAESARRWLAARGVPADQIDPAGIDRLLMMAVDAASPPRHQFPGPVNVRRRSGLIFVDSAAQSGPNGA